MSEERKTATELFKEYYPDNLGNSLESQITNGIRLGLDYAQTQQPQPSVTDEEINEASKNLWEKVNQELTFKGGVNPHAFQLGFRCCAKWMRDKLNN